MEVWKIVFHYILEIFHSILASSIIHAKIYVPFHTMPCYQITHLSIRSVKHHISSLSSFCISRQLSCLVCVFLCFFVLWFVLVSDENCTPANIRNDLLNSLSFLQPPLISCLSPYGMFGPLPPPSPTISL